MISSLNIEPVDLLDVAPGATARVLAVEARPALRTRLHEFGLRPGVMVTCQQRCSGGGRVVRVGNARVALDRTTLRALRVEVVEP